MLFFPFSLAAHPLLALQRNSFTGPSPLQLSRLRKLKHLDLSYNPFSGPVPDYSRVKLQALLMRHCGLTGSLPTTLASMKALLQLDLSSNNLTGRQGEREWGGQGEVDGWADRRAVGLG